jgi:phosphoribosylamine--glycine ligase
MMVAGGYPGDYQKGKTIYGLNSITDSLVFHAGTLPDGPSVVSNGGRVLAVTSYGKNIAAALERSYESISKISFEDAYYRKDIGKDVLEK